MAHQGPPPEAGLDLEAPAAQAAVSAPSGGPLVPNGPSTGGECDLGEQFPPCTHYDRHCALVVSGWEFFAGFYMQPAREICSFTCNFCSIFVLHFGFFTVSKTVHCVGLLIA